MKQMGNLNSRALSCMARVILPLKAMAESDVLPFGHDCGQDRCYSMAPARLEGLARACLSNPVLPVCIPTALFLFLTFGFNPILSQFVIKVRTGCGHVMSPVNLCGDQKSSSLV
jgi:hypothetical protein